MHRFLRSSLALPALVAALIHISLASDIQATSTEEAQVGFQVHRWEDRSRSFSQWPDNTTNSFRPLRVFEWYPALPPTAGQPVDRMSWGDYVAFESDDSYLERDPSERSMSSAARRSALDAYGRRLADRNGLSPSDIETLLSTPLRAVRGLEARPGRHPVVILRSMPHTLGLLAEDLAARGYVVLAPSYLAHGSQQDLHHFPNPSALERAVRDLQFTYARGSDLAHADLDRLGLLGFSSATLPTLLWQMRDQRANAIVAIEGWEGFLRGVEVLEEHPGYRPRAVRIPHLLIEKAVEERDESYAKSNRIFAALRASHRERVTFENANHFSFLSHVAVLAQLDREQNLEQNQDQAEQDAIAIYEAARDTVIAFFDRHLKDASASPIDSTNAQHTKTAQVAGTPIPTQEELARMIERGQFSELKTLADAYSGDQAGAEPFFDRGLLRRVIQGLSNARDRHDAFRLIAESLSTSTWAWIDLASAADDLADDAGSRAAYEKALEALDSDESLSEERRASLRSGLRETLDDTQG